MLQIKHLKAVNVFGYGPDAGAPPVLSKSMSAAGGGAVAARASKTKRGLVSNKADWRGPMDGRFTAKPAAPGNSVLSTHSVSVTFYTFLYSCCSTSCLVMKRHC
jgi:hypothetical protein